MMVNILNMCLKFGTSGCFAMYTHTWYSPFTRLSGSLSPLKLEVFVGHRMYRIVAVTSYARTGHQISRFCTSRSRFTLQTCPPVYSNSVHHESSSQTSNLLNIFKFYSNIHHTRPQLSGVTIISKADGPS